MKDIDTQTLHTLANECSERITAAQLELKYCTTALKGIQEELKARDKEEKTA